jgi:hypothetical protein
LTALPLTLELVLVLLAEMLEFVSEPSWIALSLPPHAIKLNALNKTINTHRYLLMF